MKFKHIKEDSLAGALVPTEGFTRKTIPSDNETIITEFPDTFDKQFSENITDMFILYQRNKKQFHWICLMFFGEDSFYFALPGEMSKEKVYKYFQPILDIALLQQAKENKHIH